MKRSIVGIDPRGHETIVSVVVGEGRPRDYALVTPRASAGPVDVEFLDAEENLRRATFPTWARAFEELLGEGIDRARVVPRVPEPWGVWCSAADGRGAWLKRDGEVQSYPTRATAQRTADRMNAKRAEDMRGGLVLRNRYVVKEMAA